MSVLAIVPARAGSKGIPNKNFRDLCGRSPAQRAMDCAGLIDAHVVLSTDAPFAALADRFTILQRPPELAQDDTPMIAVVQHVLQEIPGPDDQIILLVQPTQPLRKSEHLTRVVEALTMDWDSVVTITPIPRTHAPELVLSYCDTTLSVAPWRETWADRPTRRQSVRWPYVADGTAYAFRRRTVSEFGNIYGELSRGIIIDPSETCPLDTPEDWAEAERRLKAPQVTHLQAQSRAIWSEE